ncbi:MAG: hypothetical protein AAGG07_00895 [Planctomycetota bacterium]
MSAVWQAIDLGFASKSIAAGTAEFSLEGYLGSFDEAEGGFPQDDLATLSVTFLGQGGETLGMAAVDGPVDPIDAGLDMSEQGNYSAFRHVSGIVPSDATSAIVRIDFEIDTGTRPTSFNNANADLIELRVVPAPSTAILAALTLSGLHSRRRR